jgi:hypothetical protein
MVRGINQVMRIRLERSKDDERQWRRAYPPASRKRDFDHQPPATSPGPLPASTPPMPMPTGDPEPRSADHRNEPAVDAVKSADRQLNPNQDNEMRRDSSPVVCRSMPRR